MDDSARWDADGATDRIEGTLPACPFARPLPPAFERSQVAVAAGSTVDVDPAWRDAILVVDVGTLELIAGCGARLTVDVGGLLWADGHTVAAVHNPGDTEAMFSVVRRRGGAMRTPA